MSLLDYFSITSIVKIMQEIIKKKYLKEGLAIGLYNSLLRGGVTRRIRGVEDSIDTLTIISARG